MRAYAVRRLLMVIPTLFLVTVLVFLSVRFLPGDVIDVMEARLQATQGATGGSTAAPSSAGWAWMCRSTSSMGAGWAGSSCAAPSANH